jgi:uridine kinase
MSLLQVDPADVVIVEGILVLHEPQLRDMLNMKIYVDTGARCC